MGRQSSRYSTDVIGHMDMVNDRFPAPSKTAAEAADTGTNSKSSPSPQKVRAFNTVLHTGDTREP